MLLKVCLLITCRHFSYYLFNLHCFLKEITSHVLYNVNSSALSNNVTFVSCKISSHSQGTQPKAHPWKVLHLGRLNHHHPSPPRCHLFGRNVPLCCLIPGDVVLSPLTRLFDRWGDVSFLQELMIRFSWCHPSGHRESCLYVCLMLSLEVSCHRCRRCCAMFLEVFFHPSRLFVISPDSHLRILYQP